MTATTSAKGSRKEDISANPFQEILDLETKEEARVTHTLAALEEEDRTTRKSLEEKAKAEEEQARDAARDDLKQFEDVELTKVLAQVERDAEAEEGHVETANKKHAGKIVESLVQKVLSFDF